MTTVTSLIGAKLVLDNGKMFTLHEGDLIKNLTYKSGSETLIIDDCKVRVINAITRAYSVGSTDCPPEPYVSKYVLVSSFVIDNSTEYDAEIITISVTNIIDIREVISNTNSNEISVGTGSEYRPLDQIISELPSGYTVNLSTGEYNAPVHFSKSVILKGNGSATLSGKLTIGAASTLTTSEQNDSPVDIVLDGLILTKDAIISVIGNVNSLTMTNCTFSGHNLTNKTMPISVTTSATNPMKLVITSCTFGDQNSNSYNLIDVYAPLRESVISNNIFTADCCTHNHISLYGLDVDGTIDINNNEIAISRNLLRIGFKGTPVGTVNLIGNQYDATDESYDGDWAGLVIVQPYGSQTASFSGLNINIADTINNTNIDQLIYMYSAGSDTRFTEENKPTITIDGVDKTSEIPVLS